MIGSNMFIGTNGILITEIDGKFKEFFKVREIFRIRSQGSYLAVDCDIKDIDEKREVKLFKSKPVVANKNVEVEGDKQYIKATRPDGSTIIKVEQIDTNDPSLPDSGPVKNALDRNPVDAILRITGDFYAGNFHLFADNSMLKIGGIMVIGNLKIGTGGMRLTSEGFEM